jgi:O-antigen/teichoic acid export membrane protein
LNSRKVIAFSIGPIVAGALSLITLPFVTWFFSVEDVGRLAILQVVIGLGVSLFSLAMHQAYVREYHEEDDKEALLKMVLVPGFLLLLTVSLLILVSPFSLSDYFFDIQSSILTLLLIAALFGSFLINFLAHVVRMQERGLVFSGTQVAPKAFLVIFVGLILVFDLKAEFKTLMLMNVLAVLFSLMILLWFTRDSWCQALIKPIDLQKLKSMLKFSLPLVASGLAYWGLTTMDRFFLKDLSGLDELGLYAIAATLAGAIGIVSTIFSTLWHPVLYRWVKEGIRVERVERVVEYMLLFVLLIWTLVGLLSFIIPYLLPEHYQSVEFLIVACIAMPLFYMLGQTTGVGIGITRKSMYALATSVIAFIVNLILNLYLIPDYGAAGAAVASLIAFFVFFTVRTEFSCWLWHGLPRVKIYFILFGYVGNTVFIVLMQPDSGYLFLFWIFLFIFSALMYRQRVIDGFFYVKKKGFKGF